MKQMMVFAALYACLTFGRAGVMDADSLKRTELIRLALESNPRILAAEAEVQRLHSLAGVEGGLPDPQLTGGYFISPVETKTGPQEWRLGFRQKLPWPGKLSSREEIGKLQSDIAFQKVRKLKYNIQRQVEEIIERLTLLQFNESITNQHVALLNQMAAVIETRYRTSSASQWQLTQVELEKLLLNDTLNAVEDERAVLVSRLEAVAGKPIPSDLLRFDVNQLLTAVDVPELSADIDQNPDLLTEHLMVSISGEQRSLAKLSVAPDLTLGVDYIGLGGSGQDNPLAVAAGISLPLWPGKNRQSRKAADALVLQAELSLEDQRRQLTSRYNQLQSDLTRHVRRYNLYITELIPLAEQSFLVSEQAYQAEQVDFTDYLAAQKSLLNVRQDAAASRAVALITLAQIQELTHIEMRN